MPPALLIEGGTPEYKDWLAWMKKYNSSASTADVNNVYGYTVTQAMVAVLKQCGNDLTRENLMKQAASIHAADAIARHHRLDQRQRFRSDQTAAVGEVRRQDVAAVRRGNLSVR